MALLQQLRRQLLRRGDDGNPSASASARTPPGPRPDSARATGGDGPRETAEGDSARPPRAESGGGPAPSGPERERERERERGVGGSPSSHAPSNGVSYGPRGRSVRKIPRLISGGNRNFDDRLGVLSGRFLKRRVKRCIVWPRPGARYVKFPGRSTVAIDTRAPQAGFRKCGIGVLTAARASGNPETENTPGAPISGKKQCPHRPFPLPRIPALHTGPDPAAK